MSRPPSTIDVDIPSLSPPSSSSPSRSSSSSSSSSVSSSSSPLIITTATDENMSTDKIYMASAVITSSVAIMYSLANFHAIRKTLTFGSSFPLMDSLCILIGCITISSAVHSLLLITHLLAVMRIIRYFIPSSLIHVSAVYQLGLSICVAFLYKGMNKTEILHHHSHHAIIIWSIVYVLQLVLFSIILVWRQRNIDVIVTSIAERRERKKLLHSHDPSHSNNETLRRDDGVAKRIISTEITDEINYQSINRLYDDDEQGNLLPSSRRTNDEQQTPARLPLSYQNPANDHHNDQSATKKTGMNVTTFPHSIIE